MIIKQVFYKSLCIIILLNFLLDYLYYFYGSLSIISVIRLTIILFFVSLSVLFLVNKFNIVLRPLYLLFVYWFLLLFFSSNFQASIIEYSKVVLTLMFVPISFALINNYLRFKVFMVTQSTIMVIYVIIVLISNIFNVGDTSYEGVRVDVFKTALGDAKLYTPAFLVGLTPYFLNNKILKSKWLWYLIASINLTIFTLSLRRTTIIIVSGLNMVYIFLGKKFKNFFKLSIGIVLIGLIFSPLLENLFYERLESRKYLISDNYTILQEGRLVELFSVIQTFNGSTNPTLNYLFGIEAFNTVGNYGYIEGRPIHVDYTYIFFSSGLIGLTIYMIILFQIYFFTLKSYKKLPHNKFKEHMYAFKSIFWIIILVGFSGNVWAMTYKMFSFSILGSYMGLFYHESKLSN